MLLHCTPRRAFSPATGLFQPRRISYKASLIGGSWLAADKTCRKRWWEGQTVALRQKTRRVRKDCTSIFYHLPSPHHLYYVSRENGTEQRQWRWTEFSRQKSHRRAAVQGLQPQIHAVTNHFDLQPHNKSVCKHFWTAHLFITVKNKKPWWTSVLMWPGETC